MDTFEYERRDRRDRMNRMNRTFEIALREPRQVWDRTNVLVEYKDIEFKAHFRFTKQNYLAIVNLLQEDLIQADRRGIPLTPSQRVALTLAFYASDSFYRVVGKMMGVKKTCAHTSVKQITDLLCSKSSNFIAMPTVREMRNSSESLRDRFKIAKVALGVDGTQIKLDHAPAQADLPPGLHRQDFWCRKQFFSLNVQLIGDGFFLIRDLDVKWAGSTHDARVWRNSDAKRIVESQDEFFIAGDSAYPISPTLIKPFKETPSVQHRQFNRALSGLRTVCTENIIGVWKRRFPCLKMGLRTKLETSVKIIRATGMLHNLAVVLGDPEPEEEVEDNIEEPEDDEFPEPITEVARKILGKARRDRLFQEFCQN